MFQNWCIIICRWWCYITLGNVDYSYLAWRLFFRNGMKTSVDDERIDSRVTQGTTHMRSLIDTNFWSERPRKDWDILLREAYVVRQTAPRYLYLYFFAGIRGKVGLCEWDHQHLSTVSATGLHSPVRSPSWSSLMVQWLVVADYNSFGHLP